MKPDSLQSSDTSRAKDAIPAGSPLVSIIVSYYNQPRYLADTLRSALAQQDARFEVILVDDGSPIPAAPLLQGLSGVRVFRTENQGCPAARNFGFQQSSGEYLVFLDGDDLLRSDALRHHLEALARRPDAGLSFGAVRTIDAEGRELRPPHLCRPRRSYFKMLLGSNPIVSPGSTMIRRECFLRTSGFDGSLGAQVDDYALYLELAQQVPFVRHTHCVLDYRLHGYNVSRDQERMLRGTLEVLNRLDLRGGLSHPDLRRLHAGRRNWQHRCRPKDTFGYRARSLLMRLQAMLDISLSGH